MTRVAKLCVLFVLIVMASCGDAGKVGESKSQSGQSALFELVSARTSGIDFRNDLEEDIRSLNNIFFFEYYYSGGGVAVGDVNNDGLPDVMFTGNTSLNKLYLNEGNLKFTDITEKAGINQGKAWSTGVSMADVNGDGWLDIYVCQAGPNFDEKSRRRNLLFINNQDLTFTESAEAYGLADANLSTQASFFDYDKDGDLDCFIINESEFFRIPYAQIEKEIFPYPEKLRQNSNRLLENRDGKFVDVTTEAGVLEFSYGLGLVTVDLNDDGWTDIYVANDYSVPDFLYINQKDGTFKESIKEYTRHTSWFSMGVDAADFTNDGLPDLAVVDMATPDHFRSKVNMASMDVNFFWYNIKELNRHYGYMFNCLQINNGNGSFSSMADLAGVSKTEWSWASLLADFDNDGFKDYYISNGNRRNYQHNDIRKKIQSLKQSIQGSPVGHPELIKIYENLPELNLPNLMYRNGGDLRFEDVSEEWGLSLPSFSNGAAYADLDLDGDLDLLVNNIDDHAFLFRNRAEELGRNYLRFNFPHDQTGLGGKVFLNMPDGSRQMQEYQPVRGFASAVEHTLHFGLGDITRIDRVEIIWPDGRQQILTDVDANQVINLDPSDASAELAITDDAQSPVFMAIDPADLGIEFRHQENEFDDFSKQVLLPYRHSTLGPGVVSGDFNGDGLDDFFAGGAIGQASAVWMQKPDGSFRQGHVFGDDAGYEDVHAAVFDVDQDGDQDLYVVSGGYEFEARSAGLVDRMYLNDGRGGFVAAGRDVMPEIALNSRIAVPGDPDGDGDMDLFLGGGVVPGRYPYAELSLFLRNDSGTLVLDTTMMPTAQLGMVNAAQWSDINGDGALDLVIAGEWEPVRILIQENGTMTDQTNSLMPADSEGWWYSLDVTDIDGDGDLDIVAGNVGENTKFQTSKSPKLYVYADDFDHNNTCDVVLSKEYKGKKVPVRGLQCSSEQMPFIKTKYRSYVDFAEADLPDILGEKSLKQSLAKKVETFTTGVFINDGGTFRFEPLPSLAQLSPVMTIQTADYNGDGRKDILVIGNIYQTEVETPRWDSGNGLLLLNLPDGWAPQSVASSGFFAPLDAKNMVTVNTPEGQLVLVANNDGPLQAFLLKSREAPLGMK
jgi:hypothetical protein